jgi:predicted PurR-regulated permease PerM
MNTGRLEKGFFAASLAVAAYFSYLVLGPYLGVLILAGTLAILFRPVYRGILRVVRSESLAAFISIAFAAVIIFIPLGFFGIRIANEASTLYQTLSARGGFDFSPAVHQFLAAHFPSLMVPDFTLNFNDSARAGLVWFLQNLGSLFSGVAQVLFLAFLSLFGLFYFLKDGARLKQWMLDFIPLEPPYTAQIIRETEVVMESVVRGTLFVAVIQGIVVGLGFLIFGIPNPAFWGALTMLATLIPIVGTWLVVVPAIAYLFFTGHDVSTVGFAIWSIVLVNLVFNVLSPQIMHRGSNIHPFIILLSVIGGIGAFGPIGLLIGPFIIALLFALLRVYPKLIGGRD